MKQKLFTLIILSFISAHTIANTSRYRVMFRGNPATSMTIGWDQTSGSSPVVYYGTRDYGTDWQSYPSSKSVSRTSSYKGMDNHFARLTGLRPNTAYYFVIRDSRGTSSRYWFKTAPGTSAERLSLVAGGDSRNNASARRNANRMVSRLRPHAVLFGGDMTNGDSSREWREWMDDWQLTIGSDGRIIPIVAARGNHEDSNRSIYNLFDVPSSSVYYALTFGGNLIRAYTLNTEISISGSQTSWLNSDLRANTNVVWKMAQYHKPMRPHVSSKREGRSQYSNWADLFYDNNVKLVVECDAHTVKTTWPVRPSTRSGSDEGFIRDDNSGTVYVGEGCWGAPLRSNNDNKDWTRASGRFNQFKWIFVDRDKIEVRTVKVDNARSVGTVRDNNIFSAPSNLDLWRPRSGTVVTINKQNSGGGDGGVNIVEVGVRSGNDDAEEAEDGDMYLNSSDLELVYDSYNSAGNQKVGIRFTNLRIPSGATIEEAYIQFTTDETNSGSTRLTIAGQATGNAGTFTSSRRNISDRPRTSAKVAWSPSAWNSVGASGSTQRTPDIKSIVQEIVNRSSWRSNNAMAFIISGSGERTAESYNGSSSRAPLLYVKYKNPSRSSRLDFRFEESSPVGKSLDVAAYPNPVTSLYTLQNNGDEQINVTLYSLSGSIVKQLLLQPRTSQVLNLWYLERGMYILRLSNGKVQESIELMKE